MRLFGGGNRNELAENHSGRAVHVLKLIPEYGLLWTLIVCPVAGLAVAGLNMLI